MTVFLFWNINKKPIEKLVADLAHEREVDIVMLAECNRPKHTLEALNESVVHQYNYHPSPVESRVEIFSRFSPDAIQSLGDTPGLTFRRVHFLAGLDILLVGAHLPSKLYMTSHDQMLLSTEWIRKIREYEERLGHARTVVAGDLNMDPFDAGLSAAIGFHAVSSRQIAQRLARQVQGESYKFFYNPMWSRLGDNSPGPPGTYFYNSSAMNNLFWYMFDQVLVRPELLSSFPTEKVQIITTVLDNDLLSSNGQPNREIASDHLPIVFTLDPVEAL